MRLSRPAAVLMVLELTIAANSALASSSSSSSQGQKKETSILEDFTTSVLMVSGTKTKTGKDYSNKKKSKKKMMNSSSFKSTKQQRSMMKLRKSGTTKGSNFESRKDAKGKGKENVPNIMNPITPTVVPTPTTVTKACFTTNGELRRAVIAYMDQDEDALNMYGENISDWCVSQVTSFDFIFSGMTKFNEPLDGWDVSAATSMDFM